MKTFNPFVVSSYEGPEYFCDRKEETKRIIDAIENKRNLTLISYRRMGKTGLIRHVFNKLKKDKDIVCVYVDLMPTNDLDGFIKKFGLSLFTGYSSLTTKALQTISNFFSKIKLSVSYDPINNSPSISLSKGEHEDLFHTIDDIFKYIASQKEHFVIAFDEFQQTLNYKEDRLIALLRSHVQNTKNAGFIFSGSHKHTLISMFSNHNQPFYQSTEFMDLKSIDRKEYIKFIASIFKKAKTTIELSSIEYILDKTKIKTYYVQYLCNKLYGLNFKYIDTKIIDEVYFRILKDNETIYFNYKQFFTDNQWNLLKGIAKEEGIDKPTSKYFLQKYNLGQPSSVKLSINNLEEKEFIYHDINGKYYVADLFFSDWMKEIIT